MRRLGRVGVAAVLMLVALWTGSVAQATEVVSCADGGVCVVGDTGSGGGKVFYVSASPFASPGSDCNTAGVAGISTCKYLEAAPSDQSSGIVWATTAAFCYDSGSTTSTNDCQTNSIYSGDSSAQAASRTAALAIGMGMSNTNQIYARLTTAGSVATTDYAAGIAWAYSSNSKTDWFLPSKLELNELYNNRSSVTGFLANQVYWSSSEASARAAWAGLQFGWGDYYRDYSGNLLRVRPVRAFSTTPLLAPGAPLQPTVVAGDARATVTVAAGTGGIPTSYQISASPQVGGVTKTCRVTGSSGSCIVLGLTNGQAYTFSATATNATGTSAASSASASVTPLGAPAFTLSSTSETKAQNVAITGYTVTSTGGAIASYSITPPAPAGTVFSTVTGLLSGTPTTARPPTRYTITATNVSGSARSFFTLAVTAVAPGAPLQPTVVARSTRVDVSVVAGVGGLPTSFLVEASPQVAGVTKGCKQLANESFCIVKGLTNGVAYTFTATANNALGRSVASSASLSATPTVRSCASGGPCAVGDTGRGGGIVFYVSASPFASPGSVCNTSGVGGATTCKYLEVAPMGWIVSSTPANQTNCSTAGTSTEDPTCEWSGNASDAVGTVGTAVGAGHANTTAIIAQGDGGNTAGRAATVSRAYQGGSKTDWFLPSRLELNELCKYVRSQTTGTTSVACNSFGSIRNGFMPYAYWSSTESGSGTAFSHYLEGSDSKQTRIYVRPVRAF